MAARLDALLRDHEAVVPVANPGHRALPRGGKHTRVEISVAGLSIATRVKDAYVVWTDVPRSEAGPFSVEFRMQSTLRGAGQVFWSGRARPGFVGNSVDFSPEADGKPRTYEVAIPARSPLSALRLDPGTSTGEARLLWIRLKDPDGATLKEWRYARREE